MRDEYGQSNLQGRFQDYAAALKRSQELLDSANIDNALTSAEKDRNWECYLPVCIEDSSMVFGGKLRGTKDFFFNIESGDTKETKSARIYLGERNGSSWFAKDHKNAELKSLEDRSLNSKAFIFFKKV